jgi:hypothetical protein
MGAQFNKTQLYPSLIVQNETNFNRKLGFVRRVLISYKTQAHENFVGVGAVVLEGVFFEAVLLEAEGLVEAKGGLVGADYGELESFYCLAGVVDYGLD